MGFQQAIRSDSALGQGVNVFDGHVTYRAVADSLKIPYTPIGELLN
jgi:alanine dehydrogenase